MSDTLSVKATAQRYGVGIGTVLRWIATGQLKAVNVARSLSNKKPRWRILAGSLAAFESARTSGVTSGRGAKPRRKRAAEVIRFY
jgi:hypothetical protein